MSENNEDKEVIEETVDLKPKDIRKHKINTGMVIGIFIVIAAIIIAIILPQSIIKNQNAQDAYQRAQDTVDYTNVFMFYDGNTRRLINEAKEAVNSIFVNSDIKKKINELDAIVACYELINEAEVASNKGDFLKCKELLEAAIKDPDIYAKNEYFNMTYSAYLKNVQDSINLERTRNLAIQVANDKNVDVGEMIYGLAEMVDQQIDYRGNYKISIKPYNEREYDCYYIFGEELHQDLLKGCVEIAAVPNSHYTIYGNTLEIISYRYYKQRLEIPSSYLIK